MKTSVGTALVLLLIILSCNSVDCSSLAGTEFPVPEKIKNSRLELQHDGSRTIYWIGEDFHRSTENIREVINKVPPISTDLQSDVFVLVNRKLEKEFEDFQSQFPVEVYYLDENVLSFRKSNQKQKQAFPSSCFITNSDYVIEVVRPLDSRKK
ncbi:MAG: hypothetical protein AB2L20_30585 [Mangrovibacterium sp.]